VKKRRRFKLDELRQRFRLTSTEIGVAAFVAGAFVLGLVTKCYRDVHSSPTPVETRPGKRATGMSIPFRRATARRGSMSKRADQTRAMKLRDPANRTPKSEEKLDLSDSATKQDHRQK
jgi:hypothetical protein